MTETLPRTEPEHATDKDAVLQVAHLTKYFSVGSTFRPKHVHALNDVSFTIRRGKVISLVGESGSGKSTTARLIARLMPPTRGEIIYKGRNVLKTEPRKASLAYRSDVQMIFQDPFGSLSPVHTIGYHIKRPLMIHRLATGRDVDDRVNDLLATVGLNPPAEMAKKYPHQLSGGQRQRVSIARALAVNPEILLADEPISMLDVSIRMGVLNLMEKLKEERGIRLPVHNARHSQRALHRRRDDGDVCRRVRRGRRRGGAARAARASVHT